MRQKHCALIVAAILVSSRMVRADWNKGPVIIGGDDSDEHYQNAGEYYHREVWNFLGEHVTNEKTLAVCIGCNGLTGFPGMATYA